MVVMFWLKFLQIKKQFFLHIFPVLIFYILIWPYQKAALAGLDADLEILEVAHIFLLLEKLFLIFGIWYQYLDFQMLFYRDLKEISFGRFMLSRFYWCFFSRVLYICMLLPLMVSFRQAGAANERCIYIFIVQILALSALMHFVLEAFRSLAVGVVCSAALFFLCADGLFPYPWNLTVVNSRPMDVTGEWFIVWGIAAVALAGISVMISRKK